MWQEVVRGAGVPTGNRPNLKVQMDAPRLGSAPGITNCPFLFYVSRSIEVARQGACRTLLLSSENRPAASPFREFFCLFDFQRPHFRRPRGAIRSAQPRANFGPRCVPSCDFGCKPSSLTRVPVPCGEMPKAVPFVPEPRSQRLCRNNLFRSFSYWGELSVAEEQVFKGRHFDRSVILLCVRGGTWHIISACAILRR